MAETKKRILLTFFAMCFTVAVCALLLFGKISVSVSADTLTDHLLFSEDFDSLSGIDEKFTNVGNESSGLVKLVSGGVSGSGKMAKVEKWGIANAKVPNLSKATELTLSAWVYATNPEQRIFSVQDGYNYFLKGGGIGNDDHSVVAWANIDGRAVVTNDDPWYSGFPKAEEQNADFYLFTVTIEKDCVKFYRNNLLIDSYYLSNDRPTNDVKSFIYSFYQGLKNNKISIGGGAFDQSNVGDYYIDNVRVYDYAVKTYNELYQVMLNSGVNLSAKYRTIVNNAAVEQETNGTDPIIFYDFSSVSGTTVFNRGTKTNADGTLYNEYDVSGGTLSLNGNGYLKLPDSLFTANAYSVSMDVKRSTLWNNDILYTFSKGWFDDLIFADCWIQSSTGGTNPLPVAWVITDHFSTNKQDGNYKSTSVEPMREWFNITTVYSGGKIKIYINGVLGNEVSMNNPVSPTEFVNGYIGGFEFWDRKNCRGEIDNVRIYDYALPQESVINLANSITVNVDMPANVSSGENLSKYINTQFAYREDIDFEFTDSDVRALGINFNNKIPQTFAIKQGVTAKVYFRDILNLTENLTYTATDVLPEKMEIPYSDGTRELLTVEWNEPYVFGGANKYTGTATDAMNRKSTVTVNMTYTADKTELKKLIDKAEYVINNKPLYDIYEYDTFYYTVNGALISAKSVYESTTPSASDILSATASLTAALNSATEPVRTLNYELYTININGYTDWYRAEVSAEETDLIAVKPSGLELLYYTASGQMTATSSANVRAGNYTIVIGREVVAEFKTAVLYVFLIRNGTIITKIDGVVSENFGKGTVANSSFKDVSMLSYYTSVNKNQYADASVSQYEAAIASRGVKTDIADWATLSSDQLATMTNDAKAAYDLLVPAKISYVEPFADIKCKVGTNVSMLIPSVANVSYSNGRTATARITWNKSNLDTSKAGEIVLYGTIPDTDGTFYSISVKIIVENGSEKEGEDDKTETDVYSIVKTAFIIAIVVEIPILVLLAFLNIRIRKKYDFKKIEFELLLRGKRLK